MNFIEKCKQRFDKLNTVLCIGIDPVIEKIPLKDKSNIEKTLIEFYFSILDNFHSYALAVKPNIAFFEQYGGVCPAEYRELGESKPRSIDKAAPPPCLRAKLRRNSQ